MTQIVVANHIAYHSLGSSSALNAIVDDLAAKVTQHIAQADYPHPDLANATDVSNPSTPNANTLVKRNAFGQTFLQGLGLSPGINTAALTIQLPGGVQVPAYAVARVLANGGATLYQIDQYGSMVAANGLFTGNDTGGATNALGVRSSAAPAGDIFYVGDNAGTAANRYLRVNSTGQVIGRLGLYVGALGGELLAVDANGNILNRRSHREFTVTLSPTALSVTVATGKYVDVNGLAITQTLQTLTPTSHGTLWVWWTLSYGIGGVVHFTANTAGGNATQGSATKANFPTGDLPIGYIQVPPAVTNLTNAVFDDWRGMQTGDGNAGAGGGVAITTTMITSADESGAYANSLQLSRVLMGGVGVVSPPGSGLPNNGGPYLIRSSYTSSSDYDASLQSRLVNDQSALFDQQISYSGSTMSITGGANFPNWISVSGRWRVVTSTITTPTAAGSGTGTKYLVADLSGTGPGYTVFLSPTNAAGANQRVVASCYFIDGTGFVGTIDTSPVRKMGFAQYTPLHPKIQATATALGAGVSAGFTGGPVLIIQVAQSCHARIDWQFNFASSAIAWAQCGLTQSIDGGATYGALMSPYEDVGAPIAGFNGNAKGLITLNVPAGDSRYRLGGVISTGSGFVPGLTTLDALVFGS
jgi:hypothetical protein